jgi:hypothetical protein
VIRRARLLLLAVLLLGGAAQAQGLVGPSRSDWSGLSASQRGVLAPLERDWAAIPPAQQQKWIEVANRYGAMPPDERSRVQQRMSEWSRLSPSERARARLNFQESRQLSREERQQQWEAYRSLPSDQRRALAEQARSKPLPRSGPARDASTSTEKSSLVRSPASPLPQPVGPTVVQRGSGATTTLVSKPARPPLHQQAGLPKVAATPGFVDPATLLPQRGAQGAAARPQGEAAGKSSKGRKNGKNEDQ